MVENPQEPDDQKEFDKNSFDQNENKDQQNNNGDTQNKATDQTNESNEQVNEPSEQISKPNEQINKPNDPKEKSLDGLAQMMHSLADALASGNNDPTKESVDPYGIQKAFTTVLQKNQAMPAVTEQKNTASIDALNLADLWADSLEKYGLYRENLAYKTSNGIDFVNEQKEYLVELITASAINGEQGFQKTSENLNSEFGSGQANFFENFTKSIYKRSYGVSVESLLSLVIQNIFYQTELGMNTNKQKQITLYPNNISQFCENSKMDFSQVLILVAFLEIVKGRFFRKYEWICGQYVQYIKNAKPHNSFDSDGMNEIIRGVDATGDLGGIFGINDGENGQFNFSGANESNQGDIAGMISKMSEMQKENPEFYGFAHLVNLVESWVIYLSVELCSNVLKNAKEVSKAVINKKNNSIKIFFNFLTQSKGMVDYNTINDYIYFWQSVDLALGKKECFRMWEHPDLIPQPDSISDPIQFIEQSKKLDLDSELNKLL